MSGSRLGPGQSTNGGDYSAGASSSGGPPRTVDLWRDRRV